MMMASRPLRAAEADEGTSNSSCSNEGRRWLACPPLPAQPLPLVLQAHDLSPGPCASAEVRCDDCDAMWL